MDFKLDKAHQLQQQLFRNFAETEIKPLAKDMDEAEAYDMELLAKIQKCGFLGIPYAREYGGAGSDTLAYTLCMEEMSKIDASTGIMISVHTSLCCSCINNFGTEDQKQRFLRPLIDGSKVALSELRGKVVLLNFWATWCPPCREELSHVQQQVIDRFAGEEFVFLPISRGEERAAVEAFRAKTGYAFPMGLDTDETIYKRYATRFIPRNFLIDRTGRVVKATVGYDDEEFAELLCAAAAEIQQK